MRLKDEETDCHRRKWLCQQWVITFKELVESDEVTQRFTHLLSVDGNHIVVHPIFHRLVTQCCARLCNLCLVVWEHQVHTATVDVECIAKIFCTHSRALQVPTRETFAPWRWPVHNMLWCCFFPQCKVCRTAFFALSIQFASSFEQFVDISTRQFSVVIVFVIFLYIEIHRTFRLVCITCFENLFHKLDLLNDMSRCVWLY